MKKLLPVLILVALFVAVSTTAALAAPEKQGGGQVHVVAWGESLSGIATRYGVTVEALMAANRLANPNMIYIGQQLIIPAFSYPTPGGYPKQDGCGYYHTVKMGETLSGIAWYYNVSLQALLQCNNLYDADLVQIGQTLCIPTAVSAGYAPQPAYQTAPYRPPAGAHYHTVAAGETLSGIAQRYGTDSWSIVRANGLRDASYIWTGQRLAIPGYQPQPAYVKAAPGYQAAPPVYQPTAPVKAHPPAAPGYEHPPAAPVYTKSYDDKPFAPSYQPSDAGKTPPPPDYQPSPASAPLPVAEHPVTVVVNGGETWADEIAVMPDPDGITTLLVQTGNELDRTVRVRSGDYEVKGESEFSAEFGAYRFVFRYIPPGTYDVWIDDPDTPSEVAQVEVNAGERVSAFFDKKVRFQGQTFASPDGWYLADWKNPSKPGENIGGWSNILVRTPASGLNVMIESEGGGYKAKCFTGSKGPGACDLAGLMAGIYYIWIDGTDLTLKTYMDGAAYAEFDFAHQ